MSGKGLGGVAVVALALGLVVSPALAKTNCRRLCKSALRACKPASNPCFGMKGAAKTSCRRQERTDVRGCKGSIVNTCRATGACG